MRGQNYVGRTEQTRKYVVFDHIVTAVFIEVFLFFFIHIKTCGTDLVGAKSFNQIFCVDEFTTTGVDDHHAFLHFGNAFGVDDVFGVGREWAVQRDDVGFGVEGVEVYHFYIILLCKFVVGIEVVGHNAHTKSVEDFDEYLSDFTHTHKAYGAAVHIKP